MKSFLGATIRKNFLKRRFFCLTLEKKEAVYLVCRALFYLLKTFISISAFALVITGRKLGLPDFLFIISLEVVLKQNTPHCCRVFDKIILTRPSYQYP